MNEGVPIGVVKKYPFPQAVCLPCQKLSQGDSHLQ